MEIAIMAINAIHHNIVFSNVKRIGDILLLIYPSFILKVYV